ncbi:Probable protein phosphatase 2C 39 [Striga hermonthica]|uniref:protein-serine/threonine phosphatase n=1 Tax=Striga hermonthica TaxID=68872 RepID=A0A9N7R6L2_STRHE|nr:Probable protein phosphatase 2C 39 [Striga hermonthica]
MTGKEIIQKMKEKVGITPSTSEAGKGKSKMSKYITHGYHLVEGKSGHAMEDYLFAQFKEVGDNELGLFAIFDGHLSREPDFWTATENAIRRAYRITDSTILEKANDLGKGGSTAVTAILINCHKLVVANVGDSRAVICRNGVAKQLSIDHEPEMERETIENKGGFVTRFPGDVSRVDGQLAVARAFGDKSLKEHLSSEPHVAVDVIDDDTEFMILASDGIWKVMTNQEAVDCIKNIKDARKAAKRLNDEALARHSKDDISCIIVRFG